MEMITKLVMRVQSVFRGLLARRYYSSKVKENVLFIFGITNRNRQEGNILLL
jgi:hypothetical protein